ncbi:MAG: hypothetical protein MJ200_03410 [Mycoplasmoidaceae bacterium]|nr:hypothetical protein [Mycoplasmoidaceae bacterium]
MQNVEKQKLLEKKEQDKLKEQLTKTFVLLQKQKLAQLLLNKELLLLKLLLLTEVILNNLIREKLEKLLYLKQKNLPKKLRNNLSN